MMNREQLFASIVAARPGRDDVVYLERRGTQYDWRLIPADVEFIEPATTPDVWISLTAVWPVDNRALMRKFFEDLLAELESMADRSDRVRSSLDKTRPRSL